MLYLFLSLRGNLNRFTAQLSSFKNLFVKTTCYATQGHSTILEVSASISCSLSAKTKSHNVESLSEIGSTGRAGNQELYKLCYLSPYKPSVSCSLSVRKSRSLRPINQNHIAIFPVQQGIFDTCGPLVFIL